jgi:hypothetical protein
MKLDDCDWISLISALVIIAVTTALVTHYYNIRNQECIDDPFFYGAKNLKKNYGYPVYGTINIMVNNPRIRNPVLHFSDTNNTKELLD